MAKITNFMQNIKNYKKVDPTVEKPVLRDYILLVTVLYINKKQYLWI